MHVLNQLILLYCVEVWGPFNINLKKKLVTKNNIYSLENSYDSFLPEKVHTKLSKFVIGANKYSCNIACKGETGRFPLAISGILLSLKYWLHINDSNISNFDQRFTYQSLLFDNDAEISTYNEQIKFFFFCFFFCFLFFLFVFF